MKDKFGTEPAVLTGSARAVVQPDRNRKLRLPMTIWPTGCENALMHEPQLGPRANYLDISPEEYDQRIYRIMSVKRLLSLLANRENVLVKPECWDDPFENFILRSHFVQNGQKVEIADRDHFWGQCWTLHQASDAMWRIYSSGSNGVRIRSTVRKLANSVVRWRREWSAQELYVGRVRYLSSAKLLAFGKSALGCKDGPLTRRTLAATLLVKRPAFRHEREIRLLFTPHDFHSFPHQRFVYPIEPSDVVDQVMLDPRLDESAAASLKAQIADAGFHGPIKRSLLYAPPPDLLIPYPRPQER